MKWQVKWTGVARADVAEGSTAQRDVTSMSSSAAGFWLVSVLANGCPSPTSPLLLVVKHFKPALEQVGIVQPQRGIWGLAHEQ